MDLLGKKVGNYLVKDKLGAGGMGTVYLCEHPLIGKKVALKVLHDELAENPAVVERFFQEAKAAAEIGHEHIIDVIDFGRLAVDGGHEVVYLMMEALNGESLAHRLRTKGVSQQQALRIVATCCDALAACHAKGIVHRDIKPENIHLCERGADHEFVKVLDFGIVKLMSAGTSSSRTRIGTMLGTPSYMSPEQCEGKGNIDHRADIYALGVVMYELLTGRLPFVAEGFGEVMIAHLSRAPDPPSKVNPDVTPELEAIVLHALEKDRKARFQTMAEFGAAIADPAAHLASWRAVAHGAPYAMTPTVVFESPAPAAALGTPAPAAMAVSTAPKRHTTLSGATSEVTARPARAHKRWPWLAAGAGAIAVLVVMGLVLGRGRGGGQGPAAVTPARKPVAPVTQPAPAPEPTPAPQPVVAPRPPRPEPPETVTLRILSDPPGAVVRRTDQPGAPYGETPVEITVVKGNQPIPLELTLGGFVPVLRGIAPDMTRELTIVMAPEPTPAQVVPATVAPVKATPTKKKPPRARKHKEEEDSILEPKW